MKASGFTSRKIATISTLALCLGLASFAVGCGSAAPSDAGGDEAAGAEATFDLDEAIANAKASDPYVADEVCLSCHGGTYEALAARTDDLGDSNPHGGTHGWGGVSCNLCHTDGQSVPTDEDNMCLDCHAWPRNIESYIEYMDLEGGSMETGDDVLVP